MSVPYIRLTCAPGTTCHRCPITVLMTNISPCSSKSKPQELVMPCITASTVRS